jgi:hypothetical protein
VTPTQHSSIQAHYNRFKKKVFMLSISWKKNENFVQNKYKDEIMPKTGFNTKKNKNKHGILTGMMYCTVAMCIGV